MPLEQQAAAGLREGLDLDGPAPLQDVAAARQPLSHVKQPCRILRQVIVQLKKLGHGAYPCCSACSSAVASWSGQEVGLKPHWMPLIRRMAS